MGHIIRISGPLVVAEHIQDAKMFDLVKVGYRKLIGEIIEMRDDKASIQVYEETFGLTPGEPVETTHRPLSVALGPGLIGNIYDGIQRPLDKIKELHGHNITRGIDISPLDTQKKWYFEPIAQIGDYLNPGDVVGQVKESNLIIHKIMVAHNLSGTLRDIQIGEYTINETVARIEDSGGTFQDIKMLQYWPVRVQRPYKHKLPISEPLITGQRVIDTMFPIAKGGIAAAPGPFGSGKTVIQHQLAKWSDTQIVVYIGCGERGNEMTDVLREFPELIDPKTGFSLMDRTILIANTSDMPVAAREASIYTGITIAEYFRDMGYNVALMADSTSRWAEALREMSGRLSEMPGEEGYPAYLGSRLAQFYERAGKVLTLGSEPREGTLTVIGAVSPPGGDISEPVSQSTLRIVKVFWGLDSSLAYRRHFPAIHWLNSYSLYHDKLKDWYSENVSGDFDTLKGLTMKLLQEEAELNEIVQLVGMDSLSNNDKLKLEVAKSIREDFLHQNAFHNVDTFTTLYKQYRILKMIMDFYALALKAINKQINLEELIQIPCYPKIGRIKYIPENEFAEAINELEEEIDHEINKLIDINKEQGGQ